MVNNSQPYSLTWAQIRHKSGGLNLPKAVTEFIDNDIDAQKENSNGYSFMKSYYNESENIGYVAFWSESTGLTDIAHLYGLADEIVKKGDNNIGDKNHGHSAAVAYIRPNSIYSETKVLATQEIHSLEFKVAEFDARVENMNTGIEHDYRNIDVTSSMIVMNNKNQHFNTVLQIIANAVRTEDLKDDLLSIINGTKSSYMIHIMEFDNTHRYSQTLMDDELNEFLPSINLHYGDILRKGYQIVFESNASSIPTKFANTNTALSPILAPTKFRPITIMCTIYECNNNNKKETFLQCVVVIGGHELTFYISDLSNDARTKKPVIFHQAKPYYVHAIKEGTFTFQVNCVSEDVFTRHSNSLGTDLKGVDNTRGVYTEVFGRILGKPYWDKLWGAARNSGYVGAILSINSKKVVNKYFGLQSNKHNSELGDSHPVIQKLLEITMKGIIKNYSDYNCQTTKTGVTTWKYEDVFTHLFEKTGAKKKRTKNEIANTTPLQTTEKPIQEIAISMNESTLDTLQRAANEDISPSPELVESPSSEIVQSPASELVESPSSEIVQSPASELVESPSSEIVQSRASELVEQPSSELVEQPSSKLVEQPSSKLMEQSSSEIADQLRNTKLPEIKQTISEGLTIIACTNGKILIQDDGLQIGELPGVGCATMLQRWLENVNTHYGETVTKSLISNMCKPFSINS